MKRLKPTDQVSAQPWIELRQKRKEAWWRRVGPQHAKPPANFTHCVLQSGLAEFCANKQIQLHTPLVREFERELLL